MATSRTIFISATEARQNPIRERVIHDEGRAIESAILDAVRDGFYEVVVSDGTPMTQSTALVSPVADVDALTSTFYVPNHGFREGDMVQVTSTGSLPSPLVSTSYYYVIYIDADHVKLAATAQDAMSDRPIPITVSNGVTGIDITDNGSGYLSSPTVTLSGGNPDEEATALAYLANYGSIGSISVSSHGANYTDVPTVSIVAQGAGATAGSVTFKVVSAAISAQGSDYRTGDTLTIVGGAGTAATVTVLEIGNSGEVTAIALKTAGSYGTMPSLSSVATSANPGGGAGCTLNLSMGLSTVSVATGGSGYIAQPRVLISGSASVDGEAVALVTAGTVSGISVTDPGSGYTSAPTISITSGAGASAIAVLQPAALGGITITNNGGNTYTNLPNVSIEPAGAGALAGTVYMRVSSAVLSNAGSGYTAGDILLVAGGSGNINATIKVISVGAYGEIVGYVLSTSGVYEDLPVLEYNSVIGGSGTAATFNLKMSVDSIDVSSGGSGYLAPPTVELSDGGDGYGAKVVSVLDSGAVAELRVVTNGTNYTSVPTVNITAGSGAIGVASLTPAGVESVTVIDGGYGWTTASVTLDGDGIGATAHAVITGDAITDIIVDTAGSGYTREPNVIVTGDGYSFSAVAHLYPTSLSYIDITSNGDGYTAPPGIAIDGAATATTYLGQTGVDRIDVIDGGESYSSDPIVSLIPGTYQQGVPTSPRTSVSRGFGVDRVVVVTTGRDYQTAPSVAFSSPQNSNGNIAVATASIGIGQGSLTMRAYPASRDYFAIWKGLTVSNTLYTRPYTDRMDTIIAYFTDLGYTINRQTNPVTNNTLQWAIKW